MGDSMIKIKILVLFFIIAFFVSGCVTPGKESFDLGQSLAKQNRLEDAFAMYEDAAAKEPDNQEFKDALNHARALLVKKHLEKTKLHADMKPLTFDNLKNAQNSIDKALKIAPADDEVKKLSAAVKTEMDGLTKKAEELYSSATRAMETNDWIAAVGKFREIKTFYPNYFDLPVKLGVAENSSVNYYMKEAEKFKDSEEWESTVKMLSHARDIQPGNAEIDMRLKEALDKHKPEYYISKAEDASKNNDWESAIKFINKLQAFHLPGATAQKAEQLKNQAATFFIARTEEDLAGRRIHAAYANLIYAVAMMPAVKKDRRTEEVISKTINAIMSAAEAYETAGHLGNAYVWYDRALKLSPGRREVMMKAQALKDKIKQRVVKKIAIMDFTSPTNNPDAGKVMTDSLLSYLTKNATGDVKILARDVLGAILKEIELGQAGLYEIESAKKAGKLKGTDVFIFGSVLRYNVEKNIDEGYKTVNAVVAKKNVPNPAYQVWAARYPKPDEVELKTAPPQYIEEEIRETIKYKVANHRKIASVQVSFRVIDVEEGEVIITKKLDKHKEVEDTYSEGVDFANISYKAVKLPSDTELLEQVIVASVAELGYAVLSRFQNLQVLYSNSAELLKKKGEYLRAVEKYVDAIHVEELKNISSPVSENARKEIEQLLKML
jgi:curli biogenesis system outer membrane secretion channel CsgG